MFKFFEMNDGNIIPSIGFGVYQSEKDVKNIVLTAIKSGYRHIDTFLEYGNEEDIREAIKESKISQDKLFVTMKSCNAAINSYEIKEIFGEKLEKLGLEYVDLYLIDCSSRDGYIEQYKVMEQLCRAGKINSLGGLNFKTYQLKELLKYAEVMPVVNEIEYNPYMQDEETFKYCKEKNIILEARSIFGQELCLHNKIITDIGEKYDKSTDQVIIRWLFQKNIVPLLRPIHRDKIIENINIFDFKLTDHEVETINKLNKGLRIEMKKCNFDYIC